MRKLLLLIILVFAPLAARAAAEETGPDLVTIAALVNDHQKHINQHLLRAGGEAYNKLVQDTASQRTVKYYQTQLRFDKWRHALSWLNVGLEAVGLYFTFSDAVNEIQNIFPKYTAKIQEYIDFINANPFKLEYSDHLIITYMKDAAKEMVDNIKNLVTDLWKMGAYVAASGSLSSAQLHEVLLSITDTVRDLRVTIRRAYTQTVTYINSRLYFWKNRLYNTISLNEVINIAKGRRLNALNKAL